MKFKKILIQPAAPRFAMELRLELWSRELEALRPLMENHDIVTIQQNQLIFCFPIQNENETTLSELIKKCINAFISKARSFPAITDRLKTIRDDLLAYIQQNGDLVVTPATKAERFKDNQVRCGAFTDNFIQTFPGSAEHQTRSRSNSIFPFFEHFDLPPPSATHPHEEMLTDYRKVLSVNKPILSRYIHGPHALPIRQMIGYIDLLHTELTEYHEKLFKENHDGDTLDALFYTMAQINKRLTLYDTLLPGIQLSEAATACSKIITAGKNLLDKMEELLNVRLSLTP